MVADMVAFVASQFTTSTWDVGAQELCSVVLIMTSLIASRIFRRSVIFEPHKYKNEARSPPHLKH